jgi:predicted Zn-dependent protease
VIDTDGSQGWRGNGESRLREAMASWNRLKLPAEFRSVQDAGTADVQVFIVRHLPSDSSRDHVSRDYRSGLTRLTLDARGRIVRAHVAVATHAPRGAAYGVEDQTSTLLHELGHVLGLPHSEGSMTLMAARHVVDAITDEDARLARAVYARAPCSSSSVANR